MTAPRPPRHDGPEGPGALPWLALIALIVGGVLLWTSVTRTGFGSPSAPASSGSVLVVPTIVLVLPTFPPTATPTPTRTPVPTETPRPSERDVFGDCSAASKPGQVCYVAATVVPQPTIRPCDWVSPGLCVVAGETRDVQGGQDVGD